MNVGPADMVLPRVFERRVRERVLVGRERELQDLCVALTEAYAGHGSLFVVVGEPGVGKTFLVDALVTEADALGMRVSRAQCWESDGAPSYWPWFQALGSLDPGASGWVDDRGVGVADASPEPESARFGWFRQIAERLAGMATEQPLLMVFDDLHVADVPSLLLLRFLARLLFGLRILIVATYRESWPDTDGERVRLLEELAGGAQRLPLRGLGEAEVARILEWSTGRRMGLAMVRRVHAVTEGNPLFVDQIARSGAAEAGTDTRDGDSAVVRIPRSVTGTIRRRLEALPVPTVEMLALAAVVGREFDVTVIVELGAVSGDIAPRLDVAVSWGVLEPAAGEARYRFAHDLFREVLRERLEPARRAELHLQLAKLIESGPDGDDRVSELAHHYRQAVPAAEPTLGVHWSLRAAREAFGALAYEQAETHAERALALGVSGCDRIELLCLLGESRIAAGEPARARESLLRAARLAREMGKPDMFARAALALGGGAHSWSTPSGDEELIDLLREAIGSLPANGLRARVLARLSKELLHRDAGPKPIELAQEAVNTARAAADDGALVDAIDARLLTALGDMDAAERSALAVEMRVAAIRTKAPEALHTACLWSLNVGLEGGDREAVEHARSGLGEVVARTYQPHHLWSAAVTESMLALLDGRLDAAEVHLTSALAVAEGVVPLASHMHGIQLMAVRREQGRLGELEPAVAQMVAADASAWSWRCAWIGLLCELDREPEARREFDRLPLAIFDLPRQRPDWEAVMLMLSELCSRLRDQDHADMLYPALARDAGQVAVVSFSVLCRGAVDRYLGLLAGTSGRYAEAERHFDCAQQLHARLASRLWIARTEVDRATIRLRAGDLRGAHDAARDALTEAESGQLTAIIHRAQAVLDQAVTPTARNRAYSAEVLWLHRDGQLWTVGDPGAPIHLPDLRGLRYIAELLAHPGEEHFAAELAGTVAGGEQVMLDPAAKTAYRTRVQDLRAEVNEAQRFGDHQRASHAELELQAVASELSRAVGLRGHDRQLPGPAERARSSVTKAIRLAIRRIAERDPALGQHLDQAIRTGAFCCYVPDARNPIGWHVTM